jgi:hypothetical protein
MCPYIRVEVEGSPIECALVTTSIQRSLRILCGEITWRTESSRISAAVPGIVPSPAATSARWSSASGIPPLLRCAKSCSSGEKAWMCRSG